MLENNDKYFKVLNDIKKTLTVTRNKIVENANKDLNLSHIKNAYLAENQIRYNALVEQIGQEFNRYKTVLSK